jgi:hypothetical protein
VIPFSILRLSFVIAGTAGPATMTNDNGAFMSRRDALKK